MSRPKPKPCRQCSELIDSLSEQIKQLQQRQECLKKLNTALIENLSIPEGDIQCQTDWKSKYEQEVQRSCRLERQLMETRIESDMQRRSVQKKRQNQARMDNLILTSKLQGLENNCELFSRKTSRRNIITSVDRNYSTKQLVVRIVR